MKKQFGDYARHFSRHAEFISASLQTLKRVQGDGIGRSGRRACFGRSMIEMLGVLAVIGVMSIGGIALYRRAVNNHHANTILDDVNRLAFVITERGNFAPNDNIVGVEFNQTSTYSIVPFVGEKSGQYGIMVENVPKGVCEPLVDKAHIDYKVRVAAYGTIEYLDQDTSTGLVYDSFHKDICVNDMNDVILYFGDTSAQCNAPDEGETYAKCNSNADCCGGWFCWFANNTNCYSSGVGECKKVSAYTPSTTAAGTITAAGKTWVRSASGMNNWWSAQNWCKAQNKKPVSRADIGCAGVLSGSYCTTSPTLAAIQEQWGSYGYHWLEDYGNSCGAYYVIFTTSNVYNGPRYGNYCALCQ